MDTPRLLLRSKQNCVSLAGEMLASAGDDGNIILWVPAEPTQRQTLALGDEDLGDKETWRLKHMCRSMGSEIYDLAWSPDGMFFITGSMDNVARVWNAQTGMYDLASSPLRESC